MFNHEQAAIFLIFYSRAHSKGNIHLKNTDCPVLPTLGRTLWDFLIGVQFLKFWAHSCGQFSPRDRDSDRKPVVYSWHLQKWNQEKTFRDFLKKLLESGFAQQKCCTFYWTSKTSSFTCILMFVHLRGLSWAGNAASPIRQDWFNSATLLFNVFQFSSGIISRKLQKNPLSLFLQKQYKQNGTWWHLS